MENLELRHFDATACWYPVAASHEIQPGFIVQAFLDGHELALWRSSDGVLHAWENRCPHRGTRFTLGRIVDDTLTCAYHGWRFDPQGQCTTIPANPTLTPPRSACARAFPLREEQGMAWVTFGDTPWRPLDIEDTARSFCRSFVIFSSPQVACMSLLRGTDADFELKGDAILVAQNDADEQTVFLQPMAQNRAIAYLWLSAQPSTLHSTERLKLATADFKTLRRHIEFDAQ